MWGNPRRRLTTLSEPAPAPTAATLRAHVLDVMEARAKLLERATAEEWCNGCRRPRKQWGPYCGYMSVGDQTHFHSPEWWRNRVEVMIP